MTPTTTSPLSIGRVTLTVHDLDAVSAYYQRAIGLHLLTTDADTVRLGVGATVLLELRRDSSARRRSPREAGLFHTAFLLPSRGDLGRWLRSATEARADIAGASDHLVSEAIYLSDPEGNGVEVYADRPASAWRWRDGSVQMATEPLDVEDLARAAGGEPWRGVPDGSVVGHVHLQVGAIEPAETFYAGILGLDVTCRYPGATFYAAGGYHHHIATNVWNSRGAGPRAYPSTGLADVEIVLQPGLRDAVASRSGRPANAPASDALSLRDPWGASLSLTAG
jgi:catechol 2,3-dioxygenase